MMDDEHQPIQAALPAYALNALDDADIHAIAQHLDTCVECHAVLIEVQTVLGVLPYALPSHAPAPEMKARLLAAARREKRPSPLPASPPRSLSWWDSLLTSLRPFRWAATAILLVLLLGWNVYLQQQLGGVQGRDSIADLATVPTGAVIPLLGTGRPGATARLYLREDQQAGLLAISGLPTLPPERTYQLWFAQPDNPTRTGGAFLVNADGEALVEITVPYPLDVVSAIAITEEAAPQSERPTGEHLLDGQPSKE
jgi:anti-sigma-K factor RskA